MAKFCSNPGGWLRSIRLLALLVLLLPLARAAQATTIDIMLVYDNTASTWVASNGGMTAFSQDVVTRMNQAMQNSGIDANFRLVHSMQVNYNHTALDTDLDALESGSGAFAAVASARDTYGADLVAMLVDTGAAHGWVGLGYMLSNWSGSPSWGLTTNSIRSVETSHTLTHEVGHNLGADHSKYQSDDPGPNDYLDGQYSAGWYFTGTDGVAYNTIMAYDDDGYGNRYTEAPLFSNPLETYQGTAAGDANDGDNARLIEQTKDIIAAYRTTMVDPDPVDPDPVDPDPVDPDPVDPDPVDPDPVDPDPVDPDPLPDLIAISVTSSASSIAGGEIEFTSSISNQGNATASSSFQGYYLSTDSTITLSDIDTGWGCNVNELPPGVTEPCFGIITLPDDIAPGTYYFGAYADKNEEVTESDETNNGTAASHIITISNDTGSGGDYATQVLTLFAGYFGRPPAPAGYDYYTGLMEESGGNYLILVDDFFNSDESQAIYGGLLTPVQVDKVFDYLFARDAASGGLDYWANLVSTEVISVAEMAYTIAFNASGDDTAILDAKREVAEAFMEALRDYQRTASCTQDSDYAREFLAGIVSPIDADNAITNIETYINVMCSNSDH